MAVTSLWADERVYYPLHVEPYTPAPRLPKGKHDPAFRTKPRIAVELVAAARAAGVPLPGAVADCFYGDNDAFQGALHQAPSALRARPQASKGAWVREGAAATPEEAARRQRGRGPTRSGERSRLGARRAPVSRRAPGGVVGDRAAVRGLPAGGPGAALVVATTDPTTLPHLTTWYLATNLPRPDGAPGAAAPFAPADLALTMRLYGLRNWVEQGYKQVKRELGWGDFQVRTDRAIRRHWALVGCAFSFCWRVWFTTLEATLARTATGHPGSHRAPPPPRRSGEKTRAARGAPPPGTRPPPRPPGLALLAGRAPPSAQLARALDQSVAHLARLGQVHPAPELQQLLDLLADGYSAPLSPSLTKYR